MHKYNRGIAASSAIPKKGSGLSANQTFNLSQECDATAKGHSSKYFEEHHLQGMRVVQHRRDVTYSAVFTFGHCNVIQRLSLLWETAQQIIRIQEI